MSKDTVVRRIIRSAVPVDGNLVRAVESKRKKFVTLTSKPANERPFVVVRSDADPEEEGIGGAVDAPATPTPRARIVRGVKRNDNPILALNFPDDTTEEQATAILAEYSMSDYKLSTNDEGRFVAVRSDLQSIADIATTEVMLTAGVLASLDATEFAVKRSENKNNLTLVSLEFDAKRFDTDQVNSWLSKNSVDSTQDSVENSSGDVIAVKRNSVGAETDTRRVELEPGVTAVVARSETCCLPEEYAAVINEAAYGNWGWGHLDFNAALADEEYSRWMDKAQDKLNSVLRHITMYCGLPLDARKQLVNQALAQYGDFVGSVIDALPRQVMLLVTRAADANKESNTMSKDTAVAATDTPVTRAELAKMITDGVAAAMVAQRNDPATAAVAAPAAAVAVAAPVAAAADTNTQRAADPVVATPAATPAVVAAAPAATETITRADMAAAVSEAMAPLVAQITEMNNTVILRNDGGDVAVKTVAVKRTDDVFVGAIPGIARK